MKKLLLCAALAFFYESDAFAYFEYVPYEQPQKVKATLEEDKKKPVVSKIEKTTANQKFEFKKNAQKVSVSADLKKGDVKSTEKINKNTISKMPLTAVSSNYFVLKKGSLANQLKEYSEKNGYTMIWKPQNDIILDAETSFNGTYKEIIQAIFEALNYNNIKMNGILYSNKVLEVVGK